VGEGVGDGLVVVLGRAFGRVLVVIGVVVVGEASFSVLGLGARGSFVVPMVVSVSELCLGQGLVVEDEVLIICVETLRG
jgi:hypothetical protein